MSSRCEEACRWRPSKCRYPFPVCTQETEVCRVENLRVPLQSVEELENPELSGEDGGCRFVPDGVENQSFTTGPLCLKSERKHCELPLAQQEATGCHPLAPPAGKESDWSALNVTDRRFVAGWMRLRKIQQICQGHNVQKFLKKTPRQLLHNLVSAVLHLMKRSCRSH